MSRSVHLFRGGVKLVAKLLGKDRVAVVSVLPSSSSGMLVQVARGSSKKRLDDVKAFGPLDAADADVVFDREVAALKADGFVRSGIAELLVALDSKSRSRRALAARRLGWMRERAAVEPLVAIANKGADEQATALDALGEIGDVRAVPSAIAAAEKKLLSKRRAGFEALRKLAHDPSAKGALADARNRALARLPDNVRAVLGTGALFATTLGTAKKDRGLVLDTLCELDERDALLALFTVEAFDQPHLWRYAKSVWKRAMLRHDAGMFALLSVRMERLGRATSGTVATVKSGYDGTSHEVKIFGKDTQHWVARAAWRYLRRLSVYRPADYVTTASAVLALYDLEDESAPDGVFGAYAHAHLLVRILYGGSPRYALRSHSLRFATVKSKTKPPAREEAFPALWDAQPLAYLRLLGRARLAVVIDFALRGVERHPDVVRQASPTELAALLGSARPEAVTLAANELERRFDPQNPDWALLSALLRAKVDAALDLGLSWLAQTTALWAGSSERILDVLAVPTPRVRSELWALLAPLLPAMPAAERARLAAAVLALLEAGEKEEGEHDVHAQLASALAEELARVLSVAELVSRLSSPHAAVQAVAASALAVHPDVFGSVTADHLTLWGQHEHVLVRAAAQALLWRMQADLALRTRDPRATLAPLLAWVDSQWDDARAFAVTELSRLPADRVDEELVMSFCDSNHPLVQDLGKQLLSQRIDAANTDATKILRRLAEHPHANMRRYALELVTRHLQPGFVSLAGLESFFRTLLLDTLPERAVKARVIDYLGARGLADENQAEVAVRLLGELLGSQTLRDREPATLALTRIQLQFPALESAIKVHGA